MRHRELIFVVAVVVIIVAIIVAVLCLARSLHDGRLVSRLLCYNPLCRVHLLLHAVVLGHMSRLFSERRCAEELLQLVVLLDLEIRVAVHGCKLQGAEVG